MSMNEAKPLSQIQAELDAGTYTCRDLVQHYLDQIRQTEADIQSFLDLYEDDALTQADKVDQKREQGQQIGPLEGIPIGIKDNIVIKDRRCTCASKILSEFVSPYSATVIEKLTQAGMIMIGKLNMDEFAMGSSTENSAFQKTRNPWDLQRVPGGSSGGSASAVAAGQVPVSLGSDTGGSIRQPASYCGVVGVKPTYGRVSRYGLVAFASSLDQIGPLSRYVEDSAAILDVISGQDRHDATSSAQPPLSLRSQLKSNIKGLKIAVPEELFGDTIDDKIKAQVKAALDVYTAEGATWSLVNMDAFKMAISTYYIIAPAEASSNLARYDGVRYTSRADNCKSLTEMYVKTRGEGFGDEVKRRILLGTYVLSSGYYDAYYLKAQKVRTLIKQAYDRVFKDADLVLSPTVPTTAFKIGEKVDDPLAMYASDLATIPANMAGLPAISLPCGQVDGLPVGMQLTAPAFEEQRMMDAAYGFQLLSDHHLAQPKMALAKG